MQTLNMIERLVTGLNFDPPDEDMGVKETLLTEFLDEIDEYYSVVYEGLEPEEICELTETESAERYAERYMSNVFKYLDELTEDIKDKRDSIYRTKVDEQLIAEYIRNSKQFKERSAK